MLLQPGSSSGTRARLLGVRRVAIDAVGRRDDDAFVREERQRIALPVAGAGGADAGAIEACDGPRRFSVSRLEVLIPADLLSREDSQHEQHQRGAGDAARAPHAADADGIDDRQRRVDRHQIAVRLRVDVRAADEEHHWERRSADVEERDEPLPMDVPERQHGDDQQDEKERDERRRPAQRISEAEQHLQHHAGDVRQRRSQACDVEPVESAI